MDLAIYDLTGEYTYSTVNGYTSVSAATTLTTADSSAATTRAEVIAGKVLKFLLTYKGSAAFDPTYGGTAMYWKNISESTFLQFKTELQDDITNCKDYIIAKESNLDTDTERLANIEVVSVDYSRSTDPTAIAVYIAVTTTSGNIVVARMESTN